MAGIFDALRSLFGWGTTEGFRVQYSSDGRSGYVHYRSQECDLDLYYEFGGGSVVASISVPSAEEWTSKTGLPLERRAPILHNIGRQVARDQTTAGRGSYEIQGQWINILS